jgi:hypothetical protein
MQQILGPESSKSITKLITDPVQSDPTRPQGKFIREAKAPGEFPNLRSFAEGNDIFAGEVINPGLVMCLSNLLNLVRAVGDESVSLFGKYSIDEINLFARTLPAPSGEATFRAGISAVAAGTGGSALNVLVEYLPLQVKCALPTMDDLRLQLRRMANR